MDLALRVCHPEGPSLMLHAQADSTGFLRPGERLPCSVGSLWGGRLSGDILNLNSEKATCLVRLLDLNQ